MIYDQTQFLMVSEINSSDLIEYVDESYLPYNLFNENIRKLGLDRCANIKLTKEQKIAFTPSNWLMCGVITWEEIIKVKTENHY